MQTSSTEPLVTFNHRYKAIHKVAFELSPNQQNNRTMIVEYAKKLPQNTRDKLLRKIANSYIQTLDDAFKQAIKINRETSFVEAASERYNDQNGMKIETQINELDDSFQDCDINAMNTRSINRSRDGSFNRSFDRSSSRNNSFNSPNNSRSSYRNSYPNNNDSYNRQGYNRDNNRNRGYQHTQDMNREVKTTKTGMITIKIETGLTTEEDLTNTSITGTNPKHKSSSNSQART